MITDGFMGQMVINYDNLCFRFTVDIYYNSSSANFLANHVHEYFMFDSFL